MLEAEDRFGRIEESALMTGDDPSGTPIRSEGDGGAAGRGAKSGTGGNVDITASPGVGTSVATGDGGGHWSSIDDQPVARGLLR